MSKPVPLCQGLKADRSKCGSPALRGGTLCYYHNRLANREAIPHDSPLYAIPNLTSARALQQANQNLLRAYYAGHHSAQEMSLMLHGLQIAHGLLRDLNGEKRKKKKKKTAKLKAFTLHGII